VALRLDHTLIQQHGQTLAYRTVTDITPIGELINGCELHPAELLKKLMVDWR
jgi:hypothetical protein